VEVKMSPSEVDTAAVHLLKFSNNVDKQAQGEPAALAIITATGAAGQRSDGVHVAPINRESWAGVERLTFEAVECSRLGSPDADGHPTPGRCSPFTLNCLRRGWVLELRR